MGPGDVGGIPGVDGGEVIAASDAVWIAVSGAVVAICLLAVVAVALVLRRDMHTKLGSMEITLGHVDQAVNNREDGSLTISEEVSEINVKVTGLERSRDETTATTKALTDEAARLAKVLESLLGRVDVLEHSTPAAPCPIDDSDGA
jgi:septal ring factor EnvC (AmiA/AmiB activator)